MMMMMMMTRAGARLQAQGGAAEANLADGGGAADGSDGGETDGNGDDGRVDGVSPRSRRRTRERQGTVATNPLASSPVRRAVRCAVVVSGDALLVVGGVRALIRPLRRSHTRRPPLSLWLFP